MNLCIDELKICKSCAIFLVDCKNRNWQVPQCLLGSICPVTPVHRPCDACRISIPLMLGIDVSACVSFFESHIQSGLTILNPKCSPKAPPEAIECKIEPQIIFDSKSPPISPKPEVPKIDVKTITKEKSTVSTIVRSKNILSNVRALKKKNVSCKVCGATERVTIRTALCHILSIKCQNFL